MVVKVPYNLLSEEALQGVIEEFVLREGTDYGHQERTLEGKVKQVLSQLKSGRASIVFDPDTHSQSIVLED